MTSARHFDTLFEYRHFDREIIILCVRWYVSYKLSYRALVEMMAEREVAGLQNLCQCGEGDRLDWACSLDPQGPVHADPETGP